MIGYVVVSILVSASTFLAVIALWLIGLEWFLRREKNISNHANWLKDLGLRETCLVMYQIHLSCGIEE